MLLSQPMLQLFARMPPSKRGLDKEHRRPCPHDELVVVLRCQESDAFLGWIVGRSI
jgi:hypothetical protein